MNAARLKIWDDDSCRRVHEATLDLLADTGVEVRYAPATEVFAKAGAQVDGTRVRIPAELVAAAIRSAPRDWTIRPRGGETEPLVLDAGHTYCGTGSDVLYVCDPDTRERRRVRRADVEGMAALCEKLPNIDFVMSMGLPEDAPQAIDDLVQVDAMMRGTRKTLLVAPRDGHILGKMKEMAALAGEAESFGIYAMPVPPLLFDEDGASKVIACAELSVPLIWAPAPNAGTTAPASITSVIVVANAEVLAGLVLSQAIRPGAPFVWGVGVGAMNMRTMNEVYSSAD
ncbi:MAG TPA: trimethylamine methyltransferase family protein, partial [Thermoleophilia bacterium]